MNNCSLPSNKTTLFEVINTTNKTLLLNVCNSSNVFSNLSDVYNSKKIFNIPINTTIQARDIDNTYSSYTLVNPNGTWIFDLDDNITSRRSNNDYNNTLYVTPMTTPTQYNNGIDDNHDYKNTTNNIAYILGGTLGGTTFASMIALAYMCYRYIYKKKLDISNPVADNNALNDIISNITNIHTNLPKHVKINDEYFIKEDYVPKKNDEIVVLKGDIICLLDVFSDNWCKVELNGLIGIIPLNCIDFTILIEPTRD